MVESLIAPAQTTATGAASKPDSVSGMTPEQIDQVMNNSVGSLYMIATQFSYETLKASGWRNRDVGLAVVQPVLPIKLTGMPVLPQLFSGTLF